jgi:hypothetical protein
MKKRIVEGNAKYISKNTDTIWEIRLYDSGDSKSLTPKGEIVKDGAIVPNNKIRAELESILSDIGVTIDTSSYPSSPPSGQGSNPAYTWRLAEDIIKIINA